METTAIIIGIIPLTIYFTISLLVKRYIKAHIPNEYTRKEYMKAKKVNDRLSDLLKPLFMLSTLFILFLSNNDFEEILSDLLGFILRIILLFMTTWLSIIQLKKLRTILLTIKNNSANTN